MIIPDLDRNGKFVRVTQLKSLDYAAIGKTLLLLQGFQGSPSGQRTGFCGKCHRLANVPHKGLPKAWGEPSEVELTGFGRFQKEMWVYRNPFRTVKFDYYGRVVDWSPKT